MPGAGASLPRAGRPLWHQARFRMVAAATGRGELGHRLNFEIAVDVVRRHFLVLLAGPAEATLVSRHRYAWHHRGHSA